jgi:hypothetical protein
MKRLTLPLFMVSATDSAIRIRIAIGGLYLKRPYLAAAGSSETGLACPYVLLLAMCSCSRGRGRCRNHNGRIFGVVFLAIDIAIRGRRWLRPSRLEANPARSRRLGGAVPGTELLLQNKANFGHVVDSVSFIRNQRLRRRIGEARVKDADTALTMRHSDIIIVIG